MIVASAVLYDRGHVVMQHLVKHDGLHEKAGDPRLVEHRVNPNQALLRKVRPQLQGPLPALRLNALGPGDANIDLAAEMPPRQVVRKRPEIVMTPFGPQGRLWGARGNETRPVLFDEAVYRPGSVGITVAQVVAHGIEDVLIGSQEHVVDANLEPSSPGAGGQHGASVVGHDETDGLPQAIGQRTAPLGGAGVGPVQIVLATLYNAALRDRRRFACKLERELEHATLG